MKIQRLLPLCLLALTTPSLAAEDFLDRLDQVLTVTAFQDTLRTRLSGLLDLEGYFYNKPAPGLLDTQSGSLFNPRLTLFLDTQLGSHVYLFVQSRLDRGFDPSDAGPEMRLDEYALRIAPGDRGKFNVQIGKFASVAGNWRERHLSWENPFITAPLPYENITAVSDTEAPTSAHDFLDRNFTDKYEYSPIIWGPSYTTGVSVAGQLGRFDYAAEVKNASLSSNPRSWDATDIGFQHPTYTIHLGFRPTLTWNFGLSASTGPYFRPETLPTLPVYHGIGDYSEHILGQDVLFAWHHWQLWAEVYESRFEVPRVGNADSVAYFVEAKYKFTAQLFGALRWNQHLFATVIDGRGGRAPWGDDLWRIDSALGYRFTAHTQLKLQYSLRQQSGADQEFNHFLAAQFTLRF